MKEEAAQNLIILSINIDDWSLSFDLSLWVVGLIAAAVIIFLLWNWKSGYFGLKEYELDEAEFGIGNQKLKLKPNLTDQQIAYEIWVELSTRKIGLEIDFEHDVIYDIYDSWHEFFSITRGLIREISVSKVKKKSTQTIINLSIDLLNEGLRPHLTRWQARFRFWLERELKHRNDDKALSPQDIQAQFPEFDKLREDMNRVNKKLITYRKTMRKLVFGE